jgi:8-oxo-dGTP pyrophosphatase MutT (NUDIX family)
MNEKKLFEVVATAIILEKPFEVGSKEKPRFLIMRRAAHEKFGAGKWTVPGGKLTTDDLLTMKKQTEDYWYGSIETALRREVKEEANLEIKNIWYLTSLTRITDEGFGNTVISFVADQAGGEVKLCEDLDDYAWVTTEEAKKYPLFDGIVEEFYMIERYIAGERDVEWKRMD